MRCRVSALETRRQSSSAEPAVLWLMQPTPTEGYGEHMPGWDLQHPLIGQSIFCPRAPAQLCWLVRKVAEPSLVPSLPLVDRPARSLLSASPQPPARAAPSSHLTAHRHRHGQQHDWDLHRTIPGLLLVRLLWGQEPQHGQANRLLLHQKNKAQALIFPPRERTGFQV